MELLVALGLHEVVVVAVLIQELDLAVVQLDARPLLAGLERPLDRLAALDVAELDADLRRASSDLEVVVVEDLPQVAVELDDHTLVQVACRNHGRAGLLGWQAAGGRLSRSM